MHSYPCEQLAISLMLLLLYLSLSSLIKYHIIFFYLDDIYIMLLSLWVVSDPDNAHRRSRGRVIISHRSL
jgi:hypothetical protein